MEFVELKKHLKTEKPKACYVCYGDDSYLIARSAALFGSLAAEPKEFNLVDMEFDNSQALTEELMQLPLTGERRVVILRGKIDNSAVEEYLKRPNPSTVLVLMYYIPHDSWNKSPVPSFPSGAEGVNCNRLSVEHAYAFVRKIADKTGATISDDVIALLFDRCGGYMTRVNTEAKKLSAMRANGVITRDDVVRQVAADAEFVVFELVDSILNGDGARALAIVGGMAKNNDLGAAFTLLYNRFKRIFAASVDPDGLSELGVKPFMATRLKNEGKKFSKANLRNILDMIENADHAYKTGAVSQYDALISFVAQASCLNGGGN